MSRSETMPRTRPAASTTGTAPIRFSARSLTSAATLDSGDTVRTSWPLPSRMLATRIVMVSSLGARYRPGSPGRNDSSFATFGHVRPDIASPAAAHHAHGGGISGPSGERQAGGGQRSGEEPGEVALP